MKAHTLYLFINLFVISVPLLCSFDRKVHFYKLWKAVFPAIFVVAAFFLAWDICFTHLGYWGFDARYISSFHLLGLPPGEWLFFITVPYACLFIHYALKAYIGKTIDAQPWHYVLWILIIAAIGLIVYAGWKPYTLSSGLLAIGIASWLLIVRPPYVQLLSFSYLISLLPFLLVNGLLTGSFIEGQVVWYNPQAFSGIRIITIPMEDFIYSFDLLALNIIFVERFLNKPVNGKA